VRDQLRQPPRRSCRVRQFEFRRYFARVRSSFHHPIPTLHIYNGGGRAFGVVAAFAVSPIKTELPGPAMKLAGLLGARSPELRFALSHEIERHCRANKILQSRLIDLVAFMDVDGAPDIPVEAGVE
jgi:hypothetical protein